MTPVDSNWPDLEGEPCAYAAVHYAPQRTTWLVAADGNRAAYWAISIRRERATCRSRPQWWTGTFSSAISCTICCLDKTLRSRRYSLLGAPTFTSMFEVQSSKSP